jgi:hypothetical protein
MAVRASIHKDGSGNNLTFTILYATKKTICDTVFQVLIIGIIKVVETVS